MQYQMVTFLSILVHEVYLGHFGFELNAVAISGAQKHGTEGVPCVNIVDDTFSLITKGIVCSISTVSLVCDA